jgi:tripartite-type tricarboxylate transporter receptor subunit TctC
MKSRLLAAFAIALAAVASLAGASAQTYPTKPVKFVVGFPPGGPGDTSTRIMADALSKALGQQFVVENKTGAAGNLAVESVARAAPDGYTLLSGNSGALAVNPSLYPSLPFDAAKDFTPITMMVLSPMVFFISAESPVKSLPELVELMKSRGADLNYGTPGVGTLPHLAVEALKLRLKLQSTHVPYRGTGPMMEGVLKGEVQWAMDAPVGPIGQARAGKVRILAVAGRERWPTLPDVPTVKETGVPGIEEAYAWFALMGPAGLPRDIVQRLYEPAIAALKDPQVKERMVNVGLAPSPMTPEETAAFMDKERTVWGAVVRENNIKLE